MNGTTTFNALTALAWCLRKDIEFKHQYPFNPSLFPSESVKEKGNAA